MAKMYLTPLRPHYVPYNNKKLLLILSALGSRGDISSQIEGLKISKNEEKAEEKDEGLKIGQDEEKDGDKDEKKVEEQDEEKNGEKDEEKNLHVNEDIKEVWER